MKNPYIALATLSMLVCTPAQACVLSDKFPDETVQYITLGCPSDVEKIASRVLQCIHFAGEDLESDKERREQIVRALHKLKCSNVPEANYIKNDGEKLLKKYSKNNHYSDSERKEILVALNKILKAWNNY